MAFCKNCGTQLDDSYKVWPNCGQPVAAQSVAQPQAAAPATVEEPKGPWKVFAILGLIFGIIGLVLSWASFGGLTISVVALVFSILGLKSKAKHGMAVAGLVLSIIALALSTILVIACTLCAAGAAVATKCASDAIKTVAAIVRF